jgi:hypothetical protein
MPWEVSIKGSCGNPLGTKERVLAVITVAVPSMQWILEPAFMDTIKAIPEHPFHRLFSTWDESTRIYMQSSHMRGILQDSDLCVELYGFEQDPIQWINCEVRGNGNPVGLLSKICLPNNWLAFDFVANEQIDLLSGRARGWDAFRDFRHRATGNADLRGSDAGQLEQDL